MENFYYNEYDLDISYYKNGGRSKENLLDKGWFTDVSYYKNGNKKKKSLMKYDYDRINTENRNDNEPNLTLYHKNGNKRKEIWYKNTNFETGKMSKIHRIDKPAVIRYDKHGIVSSYSHFRNGRLYF